MVKEPHPGQVKTRLGQGLGMTGAAWWFRHQSRQLLRCLEGPRWQLILAVSPDASGLASRVWPSHLPRVPQGAGDLGDRMGRLFRSMPPGPVVIVGADIPGITAAHIVKAFKALGAHQAVFGPAKDGGYWLIGLKNLSPPPPGLFAGVRWSSAHALAETIATLPGYRVALTDTLQDVDRLEDLAKIGA